MPSSRPSKPFSEARFTLSALLGPQDANPLGNVHGGVIMKMADEAGAIVAMRFANRQAVTIAVDSMTFLQPIRVGDLVQCHAQLTYAGRTSMEVRVEVVAESPIHAGGQTTNQAYFVYVALDDDGNPAEVPALRYETELEQAIGASAEKRQAYRKQQRALEQVQQ